MTPAQLSKAVWAHYRTEGRHGLPWRKTTNPYEVLVSEVMLQQTQVDRVIPYYASFLARFPNVRALAEASAADVLRAWQGLGYNRRAKMLHDAAKSLMRDFHGRFPKTPEELETLPGVGPYTARAIAAFAYNQDVVFIETNIRTVVMHHVFPDRDAVSDEEILAVLQEMHPKGKAREWYAALMDYGSSLKRNGVRINSKSDTYAKQAPFKGSGREVRGAILRILALKSATQASFLFQFPPERSEQVITQIGKLEAEGLIERRGSSYKLAS